MFTQPHHYQANDGLITSYALMDYQLHAGLPYNSLSADYRLFTHCAGNALVVTWLPFLCLNFFVLLGMIDTEHVRRRNMAWSILRGTPLYVTRRGEKIALVPEIRYTRKRLRVARVTLHLVALEPAAVYVIDRHGVGRLALVGTAKLNLKLIAVASLLAPALNWLARRGHGNG